MGSEFVVEDGRDPAGLADRWRAAWRASPRPSPFLSWTWISAWLAATGARPALLSGPRSGDGEALGFLCRAPGTGRRRVFALNECGDPGLDAPFIEHNGLAGWADDGEAVAGLARFLVEARRAGPLEGWDELRLGGVPRAWADGFAAAGLTVARRAEQPTFAVDLAALRAAGADLAATLETTTRRQIRRALALYVRRGPLRLERVGQAPARRAVAARLRTLHQARWQAVGRPGAFASPVFDAHAAALVDGGVESGEVELLQVSAGEATIGILLNLVAGDRVASYVSGFVRERDNRLKPGLVCHALAIERHAAEGRSTYDLLAGEARYKRSLAAESAPLVWLSVFPGALSAWRAAGRRVLARWRAATVNARRTEHEDPAPRA
jgi:CelD/BcsL family acetyltransferase involved in cellulose biosynthesis